VRGDEKLSGAQGVPPVTTNAAGTANIKVTTDGAVSGTVIVPLTQTGDNSCVVPAGARLTPAQLAACKMGSLCLNVHSNANKGGEIRAQLKP
jgi:CHRD domain